jgi:hypothetical protein
MAAGDVTVFEEFADQLGMEIHDFDNDTIKLALIDDTVTPTAADATPAWGATSGVDYDANEVSAAGGYTSGGETVAVTWSEAGGVATLNDNTGDVSLEQNPSGFTDARWGILYNDSATNKNAIAFVDLGGDVSEQAGPIEINWHTNGILTITVNNS